MNYRLLLDAVQGIIIPARTNLNSLLSKYCAGTCSSFIYFLPISHRSMLIGADNLGMCDHMAMHGRLQFCLGRHFEAGQHSIERIEFMEVTMPPHRPRKAAGCTTASAPQVMRGAAGSGAPGSSMISTRLPASAGTPLHTSVGEISAPSQLCCLGVSPMLVNAGDESFSAMTRSFKKITPQIDSIKIAKMSDHSRAQQ